MEVRESRETQRAAQAGLGGARRGSEHGISSAAGRVGAKGASPREKQDLVQVKHPHKTKDDGAQAAATHSPAVREGPLGPLGFACAQHRRTSRPSVERIRRKALLRIALKDLKDPALQCRWLAAPVYRVVLKWGISHSLRAADWSNQNVLSRTYFPTTAIPVPADDFGAPPLEPLTSLEPFLLLEPLALLEPIATSHWRYLSYILELQSLDAGSRHGFGREQAITKGIPGIVGAIQPCTNNV